MTYTFKHHQGFKSTSSFAEGKTEAIVVLGVSEIKGRATPGQIKCFSIYVLDNKKGLGSRKAKGEASQKAK